MVTGEDEEVEVKVEVEVEEQLRGEKPVLEKQHDTIEVLSEKSMFIFCFFLFGLRCSYQCYMH